MYGGITMKKLARVMAAAVAVVFALSLVPCAFADPALAFDVRVSGVQVTEDNAADVFGDGTVAFARGESEGDGILTLAGARLEYADDTSGEYAAAIDTGLNLTIVVENVSEISGGTCASANAVAIKARSGSYTRITGDGVLDIGLPTMPIRDGGECVAIQSDAQELLIDGDTYVVFDARSVFMGDDEYVASDEWFIKSLGSVTIENELVEVHLAPMHDTAGVIDAMQSVTIGGATVFKANVVLGPYGNCQRATVIRAHSSDAACIFTGAASIQVDAGWATHCIESSQFIMREDATADLNCYSGKAAAIAADDIQLCDDAVLTVFGNEPLSTIPDLSSHASGTVRVGTGLKEADTATWDGATPYYGSETAYTCVHIPDAPVVKRVSGEYASDTSAAISRMVFQRTAAQSSGVVIARDDDYADALSAAAFGAPILLTDRDELSPAVMKEIARLRPHHAYVIGGEGAIKSQVDKDLRALGVENVTRVWGENSYDTSLACAEAISGVHAHRPMYAASPMGFGDALSIAPISFRFNSPIIMQTFGETSADRGFTDEAKKYIHWHGGAITVIGGEGAVSKESVDEFEVKLRLYGETVFDTSSAVAEYEIRNKWMRPDVLVIANGADSSKGLDALAGASLAARTFAPLVLANDNGALGAVDNSALDTYLGNHRDQIRYIYILGGDYVMPDSVTERILGELTTAVDHT